MIPIIIAAGMALLQSAAAVEPRVVGVTVTGAPIESVACRILNESGVASEGRLRRARAAIEWTCVPGDRLQCDVPAMEPIDLSAASCSTRTATLSFQRSGIATVDIDGPAVLEWRAETPKGTRVVATRQIDGPTKVPVAVGGRIVRLYRGQSSPVSAHVVPNSRVRIEPPRGGGEMFGRIERRTINPTHVSIDGPFESEIPIDASGRFSIAGLPAGDYQVAPVYAGGIKRAQKPLRIHQARTSEILDLVTEAVGGVVLVVAPEVCDATGRLSLTRVQAQARSASFEQAFRKPLAEGCEWQLEGLKPGRYQATVTVQEFGDLKAAEDFVIEIDRLAWADLGEPRVVVEGRVTLGEKPGPNLLLAFSRADSSGRLWVTQTSDDGSYRVAVDRPGRYAVELRAARRLGAESHIAQLHDGLNRFDLKLSETRLIVKLQRADRGPIEEIVQVHIAGGRNDRSGVVLPNEGSTLDFAGIPYGNYLVTADTNSGMVSLQAATAVVSKTAPEATVVLTLASRVGELRLIADDRRPVQGARVQVNARILSELAPGVFELKSASPGTEMLVSAPGLVPICHVLTANDFPQSTLIMSRGTHAAEIQFTPPISGPIGEITGLPGSTCPVPLGITSFGATEDTVSTTVRIVGLPEGRFSYTPTRVNAPQVMEVPGPPLKFTKPKPQ